MKFHVMYPDWKHFNLCIHECSRKKWAWWLREVFQQTPNSETWVPGGFRAAEDSDHCNLHPGRGRASLPWVWHACHWSPRLTAFGHDKSHRCEATVLPSLSNTFPHKNRGLQTITHIHNHILFPAFREIDCRATFVSLGPLCVPLDWEMTTLWWLNHCSAHLIFLNIIYCMKGWVVCACLSLSKVVSLWGTVLIPVDARLTFNQLSCLRCCFQSLCMATEASHIPLL